MDIESIKQIIEKEIDWCNENKDEAQSIAYAEAFIAGLVQAKYLLVQANYVVKAESEKGGE